MKLLKRLKLYHILLIMILMFLLSGCVPKSGDNTITNIENGILDGSNSKFENKVIQLDGEWEFYWKKLYKPADFVQSSNISNPTYLQVPSNWNNVNSVKYPSESFATYRLVIQNMNEGTFALRIPNISTAYEIWVNGVKLGGAGIVSPVKHYAVASNTPQEFVFDNHRNDLEIVIQVANYSFRDGGIFSSIELSSYENILSKTFKRLIFDTVLFGTLLLAGMYHLVLHLLRQNDKIALSFGLFCLLVSVRVMVTGEKFLLRLFPNLPYDLAITLEYLSFYICLPIFLWFTYHLFTGLVSKALTKLVAIISAAFVAIVIIFDPIVFSKTVFYFEALTILVIIYLFYILYKMIKLKVEGALVVTFCGAIFALSVLNDILFYNMIIQTLELSAFGLFVFIFSQSYIIAKKLSHAFTRVEHVSNQLAILNMQLEDKVKERTKSLEDYQLQLEEANKKLRYLSYFDATTGVPNKRFLLDELEQEWDSAFKDQTMLSILFIDIDFFKEFNDTYGHPEGDQVLKQVALTTESVITLHNGKVARYGGEEFVVLLPCMNKEQAKEIAETCRQKIVDLQIEHKTSKVSPYVTVSIGISSVIPSPNKAMENLITNADNALYKAKASGKNRVFVSDE